MFKRKYCNNTTKTVDSEKIQLWWENTWLFFFFLIELNVYLLCGSEILILDDCLRDIKHIPTKYDQEYYAE